MDSAHAEAAARARQAEAAGDFATAIETWRELHDAHPDVRWALRLAIALSRADRDDEAEPLYAGAAQASREAGELIPALVAALAGDLPDLVTEFAGESKLALLGDLDPEHFAELLPALSRRALVPGEVLIREGARANALYLLAAGRLEVVRTDEKAGQFPLGVLEPGAIVGEMALILDRPRTASVRALEETETLRVELDGLRAAAAENPAIQHALEAFTDQRLLNAVVGSSPLLRGVEPASRDALIGEFASQDAAAGTVLVTEGEPGDGVYVVVSGAARVDRRDGDRDVELATLGPGQVFGEIGLLSGGPATATVTTTTDTVLKHLDATAFEALCAAHPAVREQITRLGEQRLAEIRFIFEDDEFIEAAD